jgi:hypothetical protein
VKKHLVNPLLALASILFFYLVLELVFLAFSGFHRGLPNLDRSSFSLTAVNEPCVSFDPDMGSRWHEGVCRFLRVTEGTLVFDQVFRGNNAGCVSDFDYPYRKASERTKRVIVFGDSFSIAHFLSVPWPDRVQELLNESKASSSYEILNFSVDGGGLRNWHHTFFREIVPKYEFDAVIIASYVGNLAREFAIWHGDERGLAYYPRMVKGFYGLRSDEEMNRIVEDLTLHRSGWQWPGLDFHAFRFFRSRLERALAQPRIRREYERLREYTESVEPRSLIPKRELENSYPHLPLLWEMLEFSRERGVRVLISSIPHKKGVTKFARARGRRLNRHQRELLSIARLFGSDYFDGYRVFASIFPPERILDDYWPPNDQHWNQGASDLFASHLAGYIRATNWPE